MRKINALVFTVLALIFVMSVAATVVFSFESNGGFSLQGYADLLFDCFVFYPMFWNSVLYATAITIVQLAVIAEKIHYASLPQVTAARPERQLFPYEFTGENGKAHIGSMEKIAVPKTMLESGVFIVNSAEKNGTKRDFVRLAEIQTGEENGDYVEVVSGIGFADRIAAESTGELYNGCEVNVA